MVPCRSTTATFAASHIEKCLLNASSFVRSWLSVFKFSHLLPSLELCLTLLVIAGVERNPGPQHDCGDCGKIFNTTPSYFTHQRDNHLPVPCSWKGCIYKTCSLSALQVHVTRNHSMEKSQSSYICPVDACQVSKTMSFKLHLEEHLALEQSFLCPYGDACKAIIKKKDSFRTHLSRYHKEQNQPLSDTKPSTSREGLSVLEIVPSTQDALSSSHVKAQIVKFYVNLEGYKVLPSSTVQYICEGIASFTEMSHQCLKNVMIREMTLAGINHGIVQSIIDKVFHADPVFNTHHKNMSPAMDQVTSIHFRRQILKEQCPYVPSIEIQLPGSVKGGKRNVIQYVPVKQMLKLVLEDPKVQKEVLKSFTKMAQARSADLLEDITDGTAFRKHKENHNDHDCIYLIFNQDAFEYSPFGPAKGLYKTVGMYYMIGNLPPEFRSRVNLILLAFLIQECHLKQTEQEHLNCINKWEEALKQFIFDLEDLSRNGIIIKEKLYPVCFLFCTGDNLGSHQIASFVQSFSAHHCCRFCPISMEQYKKAPEKSLPLRTSEQYDESVCAAKVEWENLKVKALKLQRIKKRRQSEAEATGIDVRKKALDTLVSKSNLKKLQSINYLGVKPLPSVLNLIKGFHVTNGMPPCLAHDLFEGIVDLVLPKVIKHLIKDKEWFDLNTLNRRIETFKYKGEDCADTPNALKSFDSLRGHAVENWTLLRLLPFIIEDLIPDKENEYWLLYLQLKEICEYVCAPKVTKKQLTYLQVIIETYLCDIKRLLPECLTPKHHYLVHYPTLILMFGPLIRLFTLRFESRHVFFKQVAKTCKSFRNIVFTLANKYQYRFAFNYMEGLLPPDVVCEAPLQNFDVEDLPECLRNAMPTILTGESIHTVHSVEIKGTSYKNNLWLILDKVNLIHLCVGQISKILVYPMNDVYFILRVHEATRCSGYYVISNQEIGWRLISVNSLPDYFPLPAYQHDEHLCLSLKHSALFL